MIFQKQPRANLHHANLHHANNKKKSLVFYTKVHILFKKIEICSMKNLQYAPNYTTNNLHTKLSKIIKMYLKKIKRQLGEFE